MADAEPTAPPLQPPLLDTSSPRDREPDAKDLERYRKWWEERRLRKLRGQYESALVQLSGLVSAALSPRLGRPYPQSLNCPQGQ